MRIGGHQQRRRRQEKQKLLLRIGEVRPRQRKLLRKLFLCTE